MSFYLHKLELCILFLTLQMIFIYVTFNVCGPNVGGALQAGVWAGARAGAGAVHRVVPTAACPPQAQLYPEGLSQHNLVPRVM